MLVIWMVLKIAEAGQTFIPGIDMPIAAYALINGIFERICFATYGQNITQNSNNFVNIALNTTGWIQGGPSRFTAGTEYYIVVGGMWS